MGTRWTTSGGAQEDFLWALTSPEGKCVTARNGNKRPQTHKTKPKQARNNQIHKLQKKEFRFYLLCNNVNICNTFIKV